MGQSNSVTQWDGNQIQIEGEVEGSEQEDVHPVRSGELLEGTSRLRGGSERVPRRVQEAAARGDLRSGAPCRGGVKDGVTIQPMRQRRGRL